MKHKKLVRALGIILGLLMALIGVSLLFLKGMIDVRVLYVYTGILAFIGGVSILVQNINDDWNKRV